MTINPVFGRIFVPQNIEQKTKEMLQAWFPDHMAEVESQQGIAIGTTKIPEAKNYTSRNSFDVLAIDDIPLVVVISPGIIGSPKKSGQGVYRAIWRLGIGVATAAATEEQAKLQADMYGAAVRDIMLKHGGGALGGRIEWLDEQYPDLPIPDELHQFRAAALYFSVDIENVASSRGGPTVPNTGPYAYSIAETVDITLTKEPVDDS